MKIAVSYEKCIGCGDCYALCPEIFTLDDAGIAQVKTKLPVFDEKDEVFTHLNEAKKICPTQAIIVENI